jgi:hypothetical protein
MGTQVKLTGISDSGRTRKSYASPGLDTTNVPPGQSVLAPVKTYTGRLLRVFTKSHFLDYLARNTGGHVEPIMYRGQRLHMDDNGLPGMWITVALTSPKANGLYLGRRVRPSLGHGKGFVGRFKPLAIRCG